MWFIYIGDYSCLPFSVRNLQLNFHYCYYFNLNMKHVSIVEDVLVDISVFDAQAVMFVLLSQI